MAWRWLAILVLATGAVAAGWTLRPQTDPAREALDGFLAMPEGADANYPRRRLAHRFRAWMLSCVAQPQGIDVFEDLPDVVLGPERVLTGADLDSALAPIAGGRWDGRRRAWILAGGGEVPVAAVRERIGALAAGTAETEAVLALLTGQPAPEAETVTGRLLAGGQPDRIITRRFSGQRGSIVLESDDHSGQRRVRAYLGCLLRCEGPGWPAEWRVATMRMVR